jgi:hypothetical protein
VIYHASWFRLQLGGGLGGPVAEKCIVGKNMAGKGKARKYMLGLEFTTRSIEISMRARYVIANQLLV